MTHWQTFLDTTLKLITFTGATWGAGTKLRTWFNSDPTMQSVEEMKTRLQSAKDLDAMSEVEAAEDMRKEAWLRVLRRRARAQYEQDHPKRLRAVLIAIYSYLLSLAAVTFGRHVVPLWLPMMGLIIFCACVVMVVRESVRRGPIIEEAASACYVEHKRAGDVASFDDYLCDLTSPPSNRATPERPPIANNRRIIRDSYKIQPRD